MIRTGTDPHYFDADPDPSFQIQARNFEKFLTSHSLIFLTFWLVTCKSKIDADPDPDPAYHFDADPDTTFHFDSDPDPAFNFDADLDPTFQFNAEPCGSGSATLP